MNNCNEIIINRKIGEYETRQLMIEVIGQAFLEEEKKGVIWIESYETNDTIYSSFISATWNNKALGLGVYPEIKLALLLKRIKNIDSLVSHYDLILGIDPQDPFWCIAYEEGCWFLSSTVDSLLEFEDGKPGVRKVAAVDLDILLQKGYVWESKERKLKTCQQSPSR